MLDTRVQTLAAVTEVCSLWGEPIVWLVQLDFKDSIIYTLSLCVCVVCALDSGLVTDDIRG